VQAKCVALAKVHGGIVGCRDAPGEDSKRPHPHQVVKVQTVPFILFACLFLEHTWYPNSMVSVRYVVLLSPLLLQLLDLFLRTILKGEREAVNKIKIKRRSAPWSL